MTLPPKIDPKIARLKALREAKERERESKASHLQSPPPLRPRRVLGLDDEMPFGKHKGKRISEIIDESPHYLAWANDEIPDFALSDEAEHELSLRNGRDPDPNWKRRLK